MYLAFYMNIWAEWKYMYSWLGCICIHVALSLCECLEFLPCLNTLMVDGFLADPSFPKSPTAFQLHLD